MPIFSISQAPPLPAIIGAGETLSFTVRFAPTAVGTTTGVLRIDSLVFPVSGVANPPAAMPDYRYSGASGAQEPLQQVEDPVETDNHRWCVIDFPAGERVLLIHGADVQDAYYLEVAFRPLEH